MRHRHAELYVHLVWATWDRDPLLNAAARQRLDPCIRAECEKLGAQVVALGGVADHLHLLLRLPTDLSPAEVMQQVKGVSSHLANHTVFAGDFKWQGGYAAISVSPRHVDKVKAYVDEQPARHADRRLSEELELAEDGDAGP